MYAVVVLRDGWPQVYGPFDDFEEARRFSDQVGAKIGDDEPA